MMELLFHTDPVYKHMISSDLALAMVYINRILQGLARPLTLLINENKKSYFEFFQGKVVSRIFLV